MRIVSAMLLCRVLYRASSALRMMPQTQQRLADALRNLVDRPVTINLRETVPMLAIVLDHRGGLLLERAHALLKDLNRVVRPVHECCTVEIAHAIVLRWFRI